jgi:hypothetical protein
MIKKSDRNPQHARLPFSCKEKIQSIEGETVLIMRLGGKRMGRLSGRPPQATLKPGLTELSKRCVNYLRSTIANSNGGLYDAREVNYHSEPTCS